MKARQHVCRPASDKRPSRYRPVALVFTFMFVLPASAARAAADAQQDPLKSPACAEALAALDAARARKAGNVEQLRLHASRTCLGLTQPAPRPAPPRANRWAQQPIAVPSQAVNVPVIPPPRPASPPVRVNRPAAITICDASGCWADDGTRAVRIVPGIPGPAGTCTVVGGVAQCR